MNKRLVFLVMMGCILAFGLLVISCNDGNSTRGNHLIGTVWKFEHQNIFFILSFTSDNTFTFTQGDGDDYVNIHGIYTLNGNTVTLNFPQPNNQVIVGTISGNTMTLPIDGYLDFIRQ